MTKHTRPRASAEHRRQIINRVDIMASDLFDIITAGGMAEFTVDEAERLSTACKKLETWIKRAKAAR